MEMGSLLQNKFPSSSFQGPQPRAAFGQREGIQQAWLPRPTCFETVGNKFSLKSFTAENEGKRCWGGGWGQACASPLGKRHDSKTGIAAGRGRELGWELGSAAPLQPQQAGDELAARDLCALR